MHLDPQVIFFVDHHADLLARIDGHAAGPLALGVFAADELPLDEELAVDAFQLADVDVDQLAGELARLVQLSIRSRRMLLDLGAVAVGGAAMNGKSARLRARRMRLLDDDVRLRAGAPQPFAARLG